MSANEVKGLAVTMLVMATNANGGEVHVAWPNEKAAVVKLEKMGLVVVRRTNEKIAGMSEWYYSLADVMR